MLDIIIKENLGKPDRDLLHQILANQHYIISKFSIMSTQDDKIKQDIAAVLVAFTAIGADLSTIADDQTKMVTLIANLKNQEATGQDQSATVTALDDLVTKSQGIADKTKAAAAAIESIVNNPPAVTVPGAGDTSGTPSGGAAGDSGASQQSGS